MDAIDDALRVGDIQPKRSDFREGILSCPEIPFPAGGEAHEDDNSLHPGASTIESGFAEFSQPREECMTFLAQSSRRNPLLPDEDFEIPAEISNIEYMEWLQEKGPSFMTAKYRNVTCKLLLKLADDLMALPQGNVSLCGDLSDMSRWTEHLNELMLEMRAVEENYPSEVRDSGVFVSTNRPYAVFLRCLAQAVMKQGPQTNPLLQDQNEKLPVNISGNEYREWLQKKGLYIMETMNEPSPRDAGSLEQAWRILKKLADDLEVLRPGNESHLAPFTNISSWRVCWNALVAEMMTVEECCPPEVRLSGVYVLTNWPYKDFLESLARNLHATIAAMERENEDAAP